MLLDVLLATNTINFHKFTTLLNFELSTKSQHFMTFNIVFKKKPFIKSMCNSCFKTSFSTAHIHHMHINLFNTNSNTYKIWVITHLMVNILSLHFCCLLFQLFWNMWHLPCLQLCRYVSLIICIFTRAHIVMPYFGEHCFCIACWWRLVIATFKVLCVFF